MELEPIPVAEQSKALVCDRSLARIAGSNPTVAWMPVFSIVCCQVDVSATGASLVQRSPTECGVSNCDSETSIMRKSWPTRDRCATEEEMSWSIRCVTAQIFNPLTTKCRLLYLKTQFVPRSKHFSSRL